MGGNIFQKVRLKLEGIGFMKSIPHLSRFLSGVLLVVLVASSGPAEAISCLLVPLACVVPHRKYGEEMDGTILDIRNTKTTHESLENAAYEGNGYAGLENTLDWYVWFKVEHTVYQAWVSYNAVGMLYAYKPKRPEWIGKTIKLRFADKKVLGFTSAWVELRRPDGKEWEMNVVSIVGPDGIDECGKWKLCPPQGKIDRPAREKEELAAMQRAGKRSATDVAPAPVNIPASPAAQAVPAAEPPAAAGVATTSAAATPAVTGAEAQVRAPEATSPGGAAATSPQ
jgi:hypothetical protein